jgi:CspA family cold shock protein
LVLNECIDNAIKKNRFLFNGIIFVLNYNCITMLQGTVKFFNESKGFGFITESGSNTEHSVHFSGLIDQIKEGDSDEFDLKEGEKGLNAVNVKAI